MDVRACYMARVLLRSAELDPCKERVGRSVRSWVDGLYEQCAEVARSCRAHELVALVRAGAKFEKGVLVENPEAAA